MFGYCYKLLLVVSESLILTSIWLQYNHRVRKKHPKVTRWAHIATRSSTHFWASYILLKLSRYPVYNSAELATPVAAQNYQPQKSSHRPDKMRWGVFNRGGGQVKFKARLKTSISRSIPSFISEAYCNGVAPVLGYFGLYGCNGRLITHCGSIPPHADAHK